MIGRWQWVELFWQTYERALAVRMAKAPSAYGVPPSEAPEDAARRVMAKLRRAVEYARVLATGSEVWAPDFGRINYRAERGGTATQDAAKELGIPFNRKGLNAIYEGLGAPQA